MAQLVRLTYASTVKPNQVTLRQNLLDILKEQNAFNFAHNIHGVLLFGNNYFYQCLEGPIDKVEALFTKIVNDPRHSNVTQISLYPISKFAFSMWNMKYVQLNKSIHHFFVEKGIDEFDPYKLDEQIEDEFLVQLIKMEEDSIASENIVLTGWGSAKGYVATLKITMYMAIVGFILLMYLSYLMFTVI